MTVGKYRKAHLRRFDGAEKLFVRVTFIRIWEGNRVGKEKGLGISWLSWRNFRDLNFRAFYCCIDLYQSVSNLLLASMENISAQLRLAELKKTNISKEIEHIQSQATSMLLFSRQGKELTDRLDSLYDSVLQRFQELESREKHLESKEKELDSMQRAISQRSISLDLAEKSLEERRRKVQSEEDNLVNRKRLIEKRASEAKSELEQTFLVSLRKSIKESGDEVEKSLQKVQGAVQEYELLRRKVEARSQEVEAEEKRLDYIRKWIVERFSELKSKEKQFDSFQKPMEEGVEKPIENGVASPFASLQFSVTMDGPSLQIFLNKCSNEHELMRHDISFALRRSSDPAEVVLDAMQGFYPPHLKEGDVEFEANVARRSCIFLLEQLTEVLPQIRPRVKEAAMKVAAEWKMKMRTGAENLIEVLGFLQLLAAYGLASSFNAEELLQLIATVGQHRQASQLCNALGLKEAIPKHSCKAEVPTVAGALRRKRKAPKRFDPSPA